MRLNNNDVQLKRENRDLGISVRSSRSGQCSRISSVRRHSVTIAPFEVIPYPQEVLYQK